MSRRSDVAPEERVRELVEEVVEALDLDAEVAVEVDGGEINVRVEGEDLGAFIGRHGATIDAVQHLAYKVAGTGDAAGPRVNVDAAGYRDRRRQIPSAQPDEAPAPAGGPANPPRRTPMARSGAKAG